MSIESDIKNQYQKIFSREDCDGTPFKQMADYYFEVASTLTSQNINAPEELRLWIRNVQKRLYLGIAAELLLKAIFIDEGYNINKPKKGKNIDFPEFLESLDQNALNSGDTYSFNQLIDVFPKITDASHEVIKGLKICKAFRNKEGHVAIHWHKPEHQNYEDITKAVIELYEKNFNEDLYINIGFKTGEKGHFNIQNQ